MKLRKMYSSKIVFARRAVMIVYVPTSQNIMDVIRSARSTVSCFLVFFFFVFCWFCVLDRFFFLLFCHLIDWSTDPPFSRCVCLLVSPKRNCLDGSNLEKLIPFTRNNCLCFLSVFSNIIVDRGQND